MESEPARVLGLAANECAPAGVGFDCSALRRMDDEAAGRQPPPRKRVGEETRWGSGPPSSDMGNYPTGEGDRLIRGYARFDSWVAYHTPAAPDWTGTGLLPRTEDGFESPDRYVASLAQADSAVAF